MKIQAGWTVTSPEIIFPIYDLRPDQYQIETINEYSNDYPEGTIKAISFITEGADISALFPANIPKMCTEDGNIITWDCKFTYDDTTQGYIFEGTNFEGTTVGDPQPSDWGVNRYKYYKISRSYNAKNDYNNYFETVGFAPDYINAGGYNPNQQFFKNDNSDPRKNLSQIYRTANGSTFGITKNMRYSGVANRQNWVLAGAIPYFSTSNPENAIGGYGYYWCPFGRTSQNTTGKPLAIYDRTNTQGFPGGAQAQYLDTQSYNVLTIFVTMNYNGIRYTGVALVRMSGIPGEGQQTPVPVRLTCVLFTDNFWGDSIIGGGGSSGNWGADTTIDGGNGRFTADSDNHGDGTGQDISIIVNTLNSYAAQFTAGGINVFKIDGNPLTVGNLTQVLFSSDYFHKFLQSMYNPLSAILSAHLLPANFVSLTGGTRSVTAGGYNISDDIFPASTAPIANQYTWYHVGTVDISKFSDSFADFAPYTAIKLHLPYCGVLDIPVNACMGGKLGVDYVCDAISGNVAAFVWVKDFNNNAQYIHVATGNAAYTYPMFAENQSGAAVGKLVGAVGNAVIGAATGNPAALVGAVSGGLSAVTQQRNTQITGTFSGNVGAITNSLCWAEITRPVWVNPEKYQELHGITSQLSGTLSDAGEDTPYTGFVVVSAVDLDGVPATDAEKAEIETLLKQGIFIVTGGE